MEVIMNQDRIIKGYEYAKELFSEHDIDTDKAMSAINDIAVSMHCWQGDDVIGFDGSDSLGDGLAVTGNYPGRAGTPGELRSDIEKSMSLIPGEKRLNLHACYAENVPRGTDRDEYTVDYFQNWVDWAKKLGIGLDFNPTFFSHPMMDGNFSLASRNESKRKFWIEHGKRSREIAAEFGKQLGSPSIVNHWMPDGYKDTPADTAVLRILMADSLDKVMEDKIDPDLMKDALESKLFGVGIESYTVASHEFSLGYAISRGILYTLDAGHFHPTETISGKLSAVLQFMDEVLLHISRGVRWDSDHVVAWNDDLQEIMNEIILNEYEKRVHIGLDYFDASINRIAAWVIGMRNARKAMLKAALTPIDKIREAEASGDYTKRLAMLEENKSLPFAPVWDYYCMKCGVPVGVDWLREVSDYENKVFALR
jgi:L-rhamnose isomerase